MSEKIFRRTTLIGGLIALPVVYNGYVLMAKTFVAGVIMQVLGPLLGGH